MTELLDTDAAAELFGVTANAVRAWARQGKIPTIVTPGGVYRFRRQDIEPLARPAIRTLRTPAEPIPA